MLLDERSYFSQTILPLHGRMYAAALAITGSPDDAADAVQTAMMKIWEGIAAGNRIDAPAAYCLKAVRNVALNEIGRRHSCVNIDSEGEKLPASDSADSGVRMKDATSILASLPDRERMAVELTAFDGCSSEEVAGSLGVSPSNARQILSRARRHLRSLFDKHPT